MEWLILIEALCNGFHGIGLKISKKVDAPHLLNSQRQRIELVKGLWLGFPALFPMLTIKKGWEVFPGLCVLILTVFIIIVFKFDLFDCSPPIIFFFEKEKRESFYLGGLLGLSRF